MHDSDFEAHYKLALTIDCPTCRAPKGGNCRDRLTGKAIHFRVYHPMRLASARKN